MSEDKSVSEDAGRDEAASALSLVTTVLIVIYVTIFHSFSAPESIVADLKKSGVFEQARNSGYVSIELGHKEFNVVRNDGAFASGRVCHGSSGSLFGCDAAGYSFRADLIQEKIQIGFKDWYFESTPAAGVIKQDIAYAMSKQWQWVDESTTVWFVIKNNLMRVIGLAACVIALLVGFNMAYIRLLR